MQKNGIPDTSAHLCLLQVCLHSECSRICLPQRLLHAFQFFNRAVGSSNTSSQPLPCSRHDGGIQPQA